ncbi:hypothetical protein J828_4129, partial [Acinetobacter baumannii 25691_5]
MGRLAVNLSMIFTEVPLIERYVEMQPDLIGNLAFQVLHGG